ncbi:hypothetical protein CLOSYM_03931 [[Clostridium] symbiosum ATCC 14940]|uniref:Uncharacterized protein n=1 Tax=[Clostridium] symbiosum ATCC 14940 TaxID=411472 RepID=A0ABC9TT85_CLOSY|nr:hypothetical protein CLOSYM_03931 [[Clostridium] symbiosum ATCC 14940]
MYEVVKADSIGHRHADKRADSWRNSQKTLLFMQLFCCLFCN